MSRDLIVMDQVQQYLQAYCQELEDTISPDCPCPFSVVPTPDHGWGPHFCPPPNPPTLPMAQDPLSAPGLTSPCSDAVARLVPGSPLPCPAMDQAGMDPHLHQPWLVPGRCSMPLGAELVPPGCLLLVGVVDGPCMSDPTLPPHMGSPNSGFWFPIPEWVSGFYNSLECTSSWTSVSLNTISTLNHGCWYPSPLRLNLWVLYLVSPTFLEQFQFVLENEHAGASAVHSWVLYWSLDISLISKCKCHNFQA